MKLENLENLSAKHNIHIIGKLLVFDSYLFHLDGKRLILKAFSPGEALDIAKTLIAALQEKKRVDRVPKLQAKNKVKRRIKKRSRK